MDAPIPQGDSYTRWVARGLGIDLSDQIRRRRLAAVAPLYQARLQILQERRYMSDPNPIETDIARRELNEIQASMEIARRSEFVDDILASDQAGMFNPAILEGFRNGFADLSDAMLTQEDSKRIDNLRKITEFASGKNAKEGTDLAGIAVGIDMAEGVWITPQEAALARVINASAQAGETDITLRSDSGYSIKGDIGDVTQELILDWDAQRLNRFIETGRIEQTRLSTDFSGMTSTTTGLLPKGRADLDSEEFRELRVKVSTDLFFERYEGGNMGDVLLPMLRPDEQDAIIKRRAAMNRSNISKQLEEKAKARE